MSEQETVPVSTVRAGFSSAMSQLYRREVPAYGTLQEIVRDSNARFLEMNSGGALVSSEVQKRISNERHGAIRLGTPEELKLIRRIFALMGMFPVGYYDLSVAGIPVHSTAFRSIDSDELEKSPFRVFTSLLRVELISDISLREKAREVLRTRQIISDTALEILAKAEAEGGITERQLPSFLQEVLDVFTWHGSSIVSSELYQELNEEHQLVADIISFKGPHINHLTPRTLNIESVQAEMPRHGITPKAVIEGPPQRTCPILLRQTSFKAIGEKIEFSDGREGVHTARFGEVEQRGVALTPKGRHLYDSLLEKVRLKITPLPNGENADEYNEILQHEFKVFPDSWYELFVQGLAYFRFELIGGNRNVTGDIFSKVSDLIDAELVSITPITYEDFLPVSAAGIFKSNLGDDAGENHTESASQAAFESDLGGNVIDPFNLYEEQQFKSLGSCLEVLGLQSLAL